MLYYFLRSLKRLASGVRRPFGMSIACVLLATAVTDVSVCSTARWNGFRPGKESKRTFRVDFLSPSAVLWVFGAIQLIGLASAWLTRATEGSQRQGRCQCLFLGCLGVVGLATIASLHMNAGGWYLSGISLSLMVVATTSEAGARRPTTVY
jgi:hypothetical protein